MVDRKGKASEVGPLVLPIPSGAARMEAADDGSLKVVDRIGAESLLAYVRLVAGQVRDGTLELPAEVVFRIDGVDVTIRPTEGALDARADVARQMDEGAGIVAAGRPLQGFTYRLACGCGVDVAREGA